MSVSVGSHTVELQLYGSEDKLALALPAKCTCEAALQLVAKRLEIRPECMVLFGLFCGKLGAPNKVLGPSEVVPVGTDLCLQRWYMRMDEGKILKHDMNAIHLLYSEAKDKLDRGDMTPTQEQKEELESFSDPFFPTERQYLDVARSVAGYYTTLFRHCTLTDSIESNTAHLLPGMTVTVGMDHEGLSLTTEDGATHLHWAWSVVRRWKRMAEPSKEGVFKIEVFLQKLNAGVLTWIGVSTPQAYLLHQSAMALCAEVKRQRDLKRPGGMAQPGASPNLAGKFYDPLKEWVDNLLFAGPKFSKFEK